MARLLFASWNVNSLKVRLPQVLDWLASSGADALVLQETKMTDEVFPKDAFLDAGFDALFLGQRTYNGVALLSKKSSFETPASVELNLPGYPDEQKRFLSALLTPKAGGAPVHPVRPIRFCGGYFPNGQEVGSSKYLYKLDWISVLTRHLQKLLAADPRLILGGDFNIAPADADVWNPAAWAGRILCSAPERQAYERLLSIGLCDSFRLVPQPADSFSWWDYRQSGFEKNQGLRIDLLLVSEALKGAVRKAAVDSRPRAAVQPSDHAPVTVELEL